MKVILAIVAVISLGVGISIGNTIGIASTELRKDSEFERQLLRRGVAKLDSRTGQVRWLPQFARVGDAK